MKRNYINAIVACSFALSLVACADTWNEHYQADPELNGSENLWELISSDSELEDFATLLRATGYDTLLAMNRSYTVWAPMDLSSALDISTLSEASEDLLSVYRKEIVENHIADYSHVAGGIRSKENRADYERVKVLNHKSYDFEGTVGTGYVFASKKLQSSNIVASNGVLHKLEKCAPFASNIWEQLANEPSVSELYQFLYKDFVKELDLDKSVRGPIVDGKQTYLDSVYKESCRWFNELGQINNEDSTYTMYALTNTAWEDMYRQIRGCYNYSAVYTKDEGSGKKLLQEVADSTVREKLCEYLLYSNTVNKKFFQGRKDSLISTRWKMFVGDEARALMDGCEESLTLSNGTLNIINQVNYNPFTCWLDTIRVQGESLLNGVSDRTEGDKYVKSTAKSKEIDREHLLYNQISNNRIGVFTPTDYTTSTEQPNFRFYVDGVLSAPYRISIVLLPPDLVDPEDNSFVKPNKFNARLAYQQKDGSIAYKNLVKDQVSNSTKVDTIVLAERYVFEYSEADYKRLTGNDPKTCLIIETSIKFGSGRNDDNNPKKDKSTWKYDNSYRIDQVIFEPVE